MIVMDRIAPVYAWPPKISMTFFASAARKQPKNAAIAKSILLYFEKSWRILSTSFFTKEIENSLMMRGIIAETKSIQIEPVW